jgi:chemotaxis protein MotB
MDTGVAPDRLAAIGFGPYRPVTDNTTVQGRSRNRRVVVVILAHKNARRLMEIDAEGQSGQG